MNPKSVLTLTAEITQAEASRRVSESEQNRALFPELASMCDQIRAAGLNVQLVHGEEGGRVVGKRPEACGVQLDRKSTRLNSSPSRASRMTISARTKTNTEPTQQ